AGRGWGEVVGRVGGGGGGGGGEETPAAERERHDRADHDLAAAGVLERHERRGQPRGGQGEHDHGRGGGRVEVRHARDGGAAGQRGQLRGLGTGALCVAGADDHLVAAEGPSLREPGAFLAGASEYPYVH